MWIVNVLYFTLSSLILCNEAVGLLGPDWGAPGRGWDQTNKSNPAKHICILFLYSKHTLYSLNMPMSNKVFKDLNSKLYVLILSENSSKEDF